MKKAVEFTQLCEDYPIELLEELDAFIAELPFETKWRVTPAHLFEVESKYMNLLMASTPRRSAIIYR